MQYVVTLVLVFCVAGCAAVGDDLDDCFGAGQREDWKAAVPSCTRAAEKGSPSAQAALGAMYHNGHGVPQDYAKAVEWYTRAAEQGVAVAQMNLGALYAMGWGVPRNELTAYYWFSNAAKLADDPEMSEMIAERLDVSAIHMTPEDVSEAQRMSMAWYEKFKARQGED